MSEVDRNVPAALRRERIVSLVEERDFVKVSDLSEMFGISEVTIRSDLASLDEAGSLQRVHGGAVVSGNGSRRERSFEEEAGASPYDAIVKGCLTRLFPVLMTSLTTILGMVPIIVSQDVLFYSLANVIAFGLAVATTLTLLVVPTLYAIFHRIPPPTRS